jgi:hypothetical protein
MNSRRSLPLTRFYLLPPFCPPFTPRNRAKQFREGLNHMAPHLDAGLAMIIKQRVKAGAIERMDLVGTVDGE